MAPGHPRMFRPLRGRPLVNDSLGQVSNEQVWVPLSGPTQSAPPKAGAGELQLRCRNCSPDPQVALHDPQELQLE